MASKTLPAIALVLVLVLVLAAEPTAGPAQAQPPAWYAKGAYVFRVSTPDEADVLPQLEEGHAIVANLLDGSVPQITIVNGLIGHDHPGAWNWDGLRPCGKTTWSSPRTTTACGPARPCTR